MTATGDLPTTLALDEPGSYFGRRLGLRPVMISRCAATLPSEDSVGPCRAAIVQFEDVLRRRVADEVQYEWANIRLAGLQLTLEIHWYSREFFERRKNAYRVGAHPLVFQRFNVHVDDFQVSHHEA